MWSEALEPPSGGPKGGKKGETLVRGLAQQADGELPYIRDKWKYRIIAIGGSAGSFPVANRLLEQIRPNYRLPLVFVLHRLKEKREGFKEALEIKSALPVVEPDDKSQLREGVAYVGPANYHLLIEPPDRFALATTELVQYSRPSIDVFFESVADAFGPAAVGILLSGANRDGAQGLFRLRQRGALTVVQSPAEAAIATMPEAALQAGGADYVLDTVGISQLLEALG